jgi:hypothetical protein
MHQTFRMDDLSTRSTQEVFDDHLRLAAEGKLELDMERNVADDIVVLTGRGIFQGKAGVEHLGRELMQEIPNGEWVYTNVLVAGPVAFLEWTVETGSFRVPDGADSFVIQDGKIVAQTIHYTVTDETGAVVIRADGTRP